ncbi:MAG: hypothetical protein QM820_36980 [Minicystis sp.]
MVAALAPARRDAPPVSELPSFADDPALAQAAAASHLPKKAGHVL